MFSTGLYLVHYLGYFYEFMLENVNPQYIFLHQKVDEAPHTHFSSLWSCIV